MCQIKNEAKPHNFYMDYIEAFAKRLKDLMDEKQVIAKEVAAAIGYSDIYHWLVGDNAPLLENLIRLSDYFKCSIDYLVGRKEEYIVKTFKECPPFSSQLLKLKEERKFTIYGLSKSTKIDSRTIYDWKNGLYVPKLENLIKLADAFDVSIDYLVGRED